MYSTIKKCSTSHDPIEKLHTGSGDDTLIGNSDHNRLRGGAGADVLYGMGGDDTIYGDGGEGSDFYRLHTQTANLTITLGDDGQAGQVTYNGQIGATLYNIEKLHTGSGDDTLIGNSDHNRLRGGAGADTLYGMGGGDDTIYGDGGGDTYYGGAGNDELHGHLEDILVDGGEGSDFYRLHTQTASLTITLGEEGEAGQVTYDGQAGAELYNIEKIHTGSGDDEVTGNSADNRIITGAGDDIIHSGAGNDALYGGDGTDALDGDAGNDWLYGGAGSDVFIISDYNVGDHDSIEDFESDNGEIIDLTAFEDLTSFATLQTLMTESNGDVTIQLNEDYSFEIKDIAIADLTADHFLLATVHIDGSDAYGYLVGSDDNDTLNGYGGYDYLVGNAGNDTLYGGDGFDNLEGGVGSDVYYGGAGADYFMIDAYNAGDEDVIADFNSSEGDLIDLTAFDDITDFETLTALMIEDSGDVMIKFDNDYSVVISNTQITNLIADDFILVDDESIFYEDENGNEVRYGNVSGYFWVNGDDGDDALYGGEGNNYLNGSNGNDTLYGGEGNDNLYGSNGNDTLYGGEGSDNLYGSNGNDTLYGGEGRDYFEGGYDNDTLYGGEGSDYLDGGYDNDTYYILRGDGQDYIADHHGTDDKLHFYQEVNYDQLWFQQQGYNLLISIIGEENSSVEIDRWFSDYIIETIYDQNGVALSHNSVASLVEAMAAFDPPPLGQTSLSEDYQEILLPVINEAWNK